MRSPRVTTIPLLIAGLATGCTVPASITTTCSGARCASAAGASDGFGCSAGAGAGSCATANSAASTSRQEDTNFEGERWRMLSSGVPRRRVGGEDFYGTTRYYRQPFLGFETYRLRMATRPGGGRR